MFSAVVNFILLPMAFLTGAFGPTRHFPAFLRAIGDVLPLNRASASERDECRFEGLDLPAPRRLRVIAGPQCDHFSEHGIARFAGLPLAIRAEHKEESGDGGQGGPAGRRYGRLERWVTLPGGTDRDKVEARYRNGVLEVRLPKTQFREKCVMVVLPLLLEIRDRFVVALLLNQGAPKVVVDYVHGRLQTHGFPSCLFRLR